MTAEARLEDVGSGLAPVTPGWFVVNVRDAAWVTNEEFGARCLFETDAQRFAHLGIKLAVFEPGRPSSLYHSDTAEDSFLVLQGECVARIEDEERPLRQWDFLHCAPGTHHSFVGAGDGPCVLLMVGARVPGRTQDYPDLGATSAQEAYAHLPHWSPARPAATKLPWD